MPVTTRQRQQQQQQQKSSLKSLQQDDNKSPVKPKIIRRPPTFGAEEKYIVSKYSDPKFPGALGGVHAFSKSLKKSAEKIKHALSGLSAFTRHVPVRRRFPRNRVFASAPFENFHIDLIDMQQFTGHNKGFNYILICVDAFSKKAWAVPLKNKAGETVAKGFEFLLKRDDIIPCYSLYSDRGTEFMNDSFRQVTRKYEIRHYVSKDKEIKSSIAERFIRTLKGKLFKYFTLENTREYLSVLPLLLENYNNSYHSAIGMTPNEVNFDNTKLVFDNLFTGSTLGRYPKMEQYKTSYYNTETGRVKKQSKFKIGDYVRITKIPSVFEKSYLPHGTVEMFKIHQVVNRIPVVYRIEDLMGEVIDGTFYNQELIKIKPPKDSNLFIVDKILKTRTNKGVKEVLVNYFGYPSKFRKWIKESDIVKTSGSDAAAVTNGVKKGIKRRKWKRYY